MDSNETNEDNSSETLNEMEVCSTNNQDELIENQLDENHIESMVIQECNIEDNVATTLEISSVDESEPIELNNDTNHADTETIQESPILLETEVIQSDDHLIEVGFDDTKCSAEEDEREKTPSPEYGIITHEIPSQVANNVVCQDVADVSQDTSCDVPNDTPQDVPMDSEVSVSEICADKVAEESPTEESVNMVDSCLEQLPEEPSVEKSADMDQSCAEKLPAESCAVELLPVPPTESIVTPISSPQESTKEVTEKLMEEVPQVSPVSPPKSPPKSPPQSPPHSPPKSSPKESVHEVPEELTKEVSQVSPEGLPKSSSKESLEESMKEPPREPLETRRKRRKSGAKASPVTQQNGSGSKRRRVNSQPLDSTLTQAEEDESPGEESDEKKAIDAIEYYVPPTSDKYCWRCHKDVVETQCSTCPRSWHRRCMGGAPPLKSTDWICPECTGILQAEHPETRSSILLGVTVEQLSMMLRHVVQRMRDQTGSQPFLRAVDLGEIPTYLDYVIKPMDLSLLEANVRAKMYASTDAFMADAKWIQHNCIIFNSYSSKLTNTAKQMLKVARQEVSEIEACPDCFSHGRNLPKPLPSWFIEPCRRPHLIVWAKLKGFPFWPAKAMPRLNTQGLVDVRFFGEHDRAWVSPKDIYLYSKESPGIVLPKKKKPEMDASVKEVDEHSKKLEEVFGDFRYAPPRIAYNPHDPMQIKVMLPKYDPIKNERIDLPKPEPKPPQPIKTKTPKAIKLTIKKKKLAKAEKKLKKSKRLALAAANGVGELYVEPTELSKKSLRSKKVKQPKNKEVPSAKTLPANSEGRVADTTSTLLLTVPKQRKKKSKSPLVDPMALGSPVVSLEHLTPVTPVPTPEIPAASATPATPPKATTPPKPATPVSQTVSTASPVHPESPKKIPDPVNNNEQPKSDVRPFSPVVDIMTPTVTNDDNASKNMIEVKKMKSENIKKLKLMRTLDLVRGDPKKISALAKAANGKPVTVVHSLSNLPNSVGNVVKTLAGQKPKAIYIQQANMKNAANLIPLKAKLVTKAALQENKLAVKTPGKTQIKAVFKDPVKVMSNNTPKAIAKGDSTSNNKSMVATPISSKKDQNKAMLVPVNSKVSETAKNFTDKESRLSTVATVKQEPKDDVQPKLTITRKPSKARKSLPLKLTFSKSPSVAQGLRSTPLGFKTASTSLGGSGEPIMSMTGAAGSATVNATNSSRTAYEIPPPEAGPATAKIHENSKDLANRVAQLIADTIKDAADGSNGSGNNSLDRSEATIHYLKLRIERMKWEHQQQITELKHNNELVLRELKASMEVERFRALQDARREAEIDKLRCIEETKRKQWCVVCGREAMFYCCWNTAYCNYPCQQKHWSAHADTCAQKNQQQHQTVVPQPKQQPIAPVHKPAAGQVMPKLVIPNKRA
ncbi:hypothetical protein QAD02_000601 [Eretmocerus hayati]|uniref:Uncharacterized protein n=1 Tax=Eretmocerus hayati TaxID=131215 RepID=A0ACC2NGH3_9HYME|nr:hypothetical protein QAD02_000601 [Eretmocerus hayati]